MSGPFNNSLQYSLLFPPLPAPQSSSVPHGTKNKMYALEQQLMTIVGDEQVQLIRPPYPSSLDLQIRVGVIKGWNPPINTADRIVYMKALQAFEGKNTNFNTCAKLGDFPPMIGDFFPPVHD